MGVCRSCDNHNQQFVMKIREYWAGYDNKEDAEEFRQLMEQFQTQLAKCCKEKQFCIANPSGRGIVYREGKSFYSGQVAKGRAEGKGHIYNHDQFSYRGMFKDGLPEGEGNLYSVQRGEQLIQSGIWSKGKMISGQIYPVQGSRTQKIKIINDNQYEIKYKSGHVYKGEGIIRNHQFYRHGKGKLDDSLHKQSYDGDWIQNRREGQGTLQKGESKFEGIFQNDKKKQGKLETKTHLFDGSWQNGTVFTGVMKKKSTGVASRIAENQLVPESRAAENEDP